MMFDLHMGAEALAMPNIGCASYLQPLAELNAAEAMGAVLQVFVFWVYLGCPFEKQVPHKLAQKDAKEHVFFRKSLQVSGEFILTTCHIWISG